MLSRRALSALNTARLRTVCRNLGLPLRLASGFKLHAAARLLSTSPRQNDPEGAVDASHSAPATPQLPPSLLAKVSKYAKDVQSGSNGTSSESQKSEELRRASLGRDYKGEPRKRESSSPYTSASFVKATSPSPYTAFAARNNGSAVASALPSARSLAVESPSNLSSFPTSASQDIVSDGANTTQSESQSASSSFSSLKGHLRYELYQALTAKPFNFNKMSTVQEAVLGLLPELAQPSARGASQEPTTQDPVAQEIQGLDVNTELHSQRGARDVQTDLLVKAKTGTGKTLAFLVPALEARFKDIEQERQNFMQANPDIDRAQVSRHMAEYTKKSVGTVILSPTRELATQIANEAAKLMYHCKGMGVQLFIGGASKQRQLRDFAYGRRDIIVATPGRMQDMLESAVVREHVSRAKMLVLDEADTLLDMGFKDSIDQIVDQLPPKEQRQTFLFSATVSSDIRKIARKTLRREHAFIDCVPENETNTHMHIPQYSTVLPSASEQVEHVYRLLTQDALLHPEGGKAIVFLPTTKMTEMFAILIQAMRSSMPFGVRGTQVFEMHSKKTQSARDNTARRFREQSGPGYSILVTSDVSARGVDYPGVTRVIQVGIPGTKEMYVHRVGRTGRAGKSGRGDLVLLPFEQGFLQTTMQDVPLQPAMADELQHEIERLAAELDANPPAPSTSPLQQTRPLSAALRQTRGGRGGSAVPTPTIAIPVLPRIQKMHDKLRDEIIPELAETDVNEVFGSQLGFYASHCPAMRISRSTLYEGLQEWAVEAMGLANPPTVSPSLMQKLGLGKTNRSGKVRGFGAADGRRRAYEDVRSFRRQDSRRNAFSPSGDRDAPRGRPPGRFPFSDRTDNRRNMFGSGPAEHRPYQDRGARNYR